MGKDVIVACDFPSLTETMAFLGKFGEMKPFVKIGMELFYGEGPDAVRAIREMGHRVFLDLKLHDIPNTVHRSMKNLAKLGVDMTNLHAAGGVAMMEAALEGLAEGAAGRRPLLVGVTMLTSMSEAAMHEELLIPGRLHEVVAHYAANAQNAGLDGVVCSPQEVAVVREWCGDEFLTVTPGIRYLDSAADDQSRVTTPAKAATMGASYIVVGRPITAAPDPLVAYRRVYDEFVGSPAR